MESLGVQTIVFTDISKDRTLAGPNFEQLAILQKSVGIRLIASGGGIYSRCEKLNDMNIYGVIMERRFYRKRLI